MSTEAEDNFDATIEDDGTVRVTREVPDGELHIKMNPDGMSIDFLNDAGEIEEECWKTYEDLTQEAGALPRHPVDIDHPEHGGAT